MVTKTKVIIASLVILNLIILPPILFPSVFPNIYDSLFLKKEVVIDKNIPTDDVKQIEKLARKAGYRNVLLLKYYPCNRDTNLKVPNPTNSLNDAINFIKESELCLPGDIELATGENTMKGLGGKKELKYFIVRKINNSWIIIEYLGTSLVIA